MLPRFREVFDIIVLNDGNLHVVDMVVKIIGSGLHVGELTEHLKKNAY